MLLYGESNIRITSLPPISITNAFTKKLARGSINFIEEDEGVHSCPLLFAVGLVCDHCDHHLLRRALGQGGGSQLQRTGPAWRSTGPRDAADSKCEQSRV